MSYYLGLSDVYKGVINAVPTGNASETGSTLVGIGNSIDQYSIAMAKSYPNVNSVLSDQDKVKQILEAEQTRLEAKETNINVALEGKKRASLLNYGYSGRFSIYINLLIIIVVTILLLLGLTGITEKYPEKDKLNTVIVIFIYIIVILAFILIYYNVSTLFSRDEIYFDELKLSPPDASGNISATFDSSNVFIGDIYLGAKYCDNEHNIFYDKSSGLCEAEANIKVGDKITKEDYFKLTGDSNIKADYANFTTLSEASYNGTSFDQAYTGSEILFVPNSPEKVSYKIATYAPLENQEFNKYNMYN